MMLESEAAIEQTAPIDDNNSEGGVSVLIREIDLLKEYIKRIPREVPINKESVCTR